MAPLTDPACLDSTIFSTFHLREVQAVPLRGILVDYLGSKQLLLLLDNCSISSRPAPS
jgi:predicted ATPase